MTPRPARLAYDRCSARCNPIEAPSRSDRRQCHRTTKDGDGRRDSEAFTAFVLASQPRLRRTAYLMCGDWQLASDHVQEALIRVYRHWPRLRSEPEAHAYARKAVVSVVIDAKRKRSSTEVPVDSVVDAPATTPPCAAPTATCSVGSSPSSHHRPDWRHGHRQPRHQRLPARPLRARRRGAARPRRGDPPRARRRGRHADQPRRGRAADHAGPARRRAERRRGRHVHRLLLDLHRPRPAPTTATCCAATSARSGPSIARRYWERAGVADRIELRIAPAVETLRALPSERALDFAFIDADKAGYPAYYEEIVTRMRPGGLVVLDNMLRDGRVLDPQNDDDRAIVAMNVRPGGRRPGGRRPAPRPRRRQPGPRPLSRLRGRRRRPRGEHPGGRRASYGVRQPTWTPSGASVASSSCLTSRKIHTTAEPASIMKTPTRNAWVAPVGKPPM